MGDDYATAADQFDYVRFTFCDLHGCAKVKIVTSEGLEDAMQSGVPAFGGTIAFGIDGDPMNEDCFPGEADPDGIMKRFGNVVYVPQPGTVRPAPWSACPRVGQVLCEPHWTPGGRSLASGPRWVARRQLTRLQEDRGLTLLSGFEAEITLYDPAAAEPLLPEYTYFRSRYLPQIEPLLVDVHKNLKRDGVQLHDFHTEMGRGQVELVMPPAPGIQTADNAFLLREGVKQTCLLQGKEAILMTHPFFSDHISLGWHFSHSLRGLEGEPVFSDTQQADGLSDVARCWVAGLTAHCRALTALCCPTVNCYRRLNQLVTPRSNSWGIDNRHVTFRVKTGAPSATYVECRLPSSAANPYLVMAGVLAAGMDGLQRHLACPPEDDPAAEQLPASLEEALVCLEDDKVLVEGLGEDFVKCFVQLKRKMELSKFPHWEHTRDSESTFQKERDLYFTNL